MRAGDLQVVGGPDSGLVVTVHSIVMFGRDVEGPGRLSDPTVSSRHARVIRRNDGQLLIEDLGSRNGTLVNGARVQGPLLLNVGDLVRLGNSELRLEPDVRSGPAAAPGPSGSRNGEPSEAPRNSPGNSVYAVPPPPGGPPSGPGAPLTGATGPSGPSTAPLGPVGPPAVQPGPSGPPPSPGPPDSPAGESSPPGGPPWAPGPTGPSGGPPPRGRRIPPSRHPGRTLGAIVAVVALIGGAFAAGWFLGPTNGATTASSTIAPSGTASPGAGGISSGSGTVYVESNDSAPGSNAVLAYTYGPGANLQPLRISAYPTGGSGSADLTDSGVLDATGHLTVDPDRHLLLAVNQGSDTVAVFHVAADGALHAVTGSPFPSGGKAPVSIGVNGDLVVVVNKAQDGIRNLSAVAPNYTTFRLAQDGSLSPTGHTVSEPPGSSPTQALITPDGHLVFGSEESGPFQVFLLGSNGSLTPGPGSGLTPLRNLFPSNIPVDHRFGLGMSINPSAQILYAQLANANILGIYSYESNGQLAFVGSVPNKGGQEPCWSELNAAGTRLYVDNAANDSTSVYDTSNPRKPKVIQNYRLKDNGNPWDLAFDPTGRYLFVVAPRARAVNVTPGQGNQLHVETIGSDGKLSEPQAPVSIPVPLNTNPFGVAVVADS